jgi:hypothetical protein
MQVTANCPAEFYMKHRAFGRYADRFEAPADSIGIRSFAGCDGDKAPGDAPNLTPAVKLADDDVVGSIVPPRRDVGQ